MKLCMYMGCYTAPIRLSILCFSYAQVPKTCTTPVCYPDTGSGSNKQPIIHQFVLPSLDLCSPDYPVSYPCWDLQWVRLGTPVSPLVVGRDRSTYQPSEQNRYPLEVGSLHPLTGIIPYHNIHTYVLNLP